MPRISASSVFNLKPAGTPISQAEPVRKMSSVIRLAKIKTHFKINSGFKNNMNPTKFPRITSTTTDEQVECSRSAAFSAYSTDDEDLEMERMKTNEKMDYDLSKSNIKGNRYTSCQNKERDI